MKIIIILMTLILAIPMALANVDCFAEADCDGVITGFDLMQINNYMSYQLYTTECNILSFDVDGDFAVTLNDLTQFNNYLNYQPFTFDGKPTTIVPTVLNPEADGNVYTNTNYNMEILVTDSDGTPRPCIGVALSTDLGIISPNYALTDLNGKVYVTRSSTTPGVLTFTAFIQGDISKQIDDITFTETITVIDRCTDSDLDGYSIEGGVCGLVDCNDNDINVNPGASEVCGDGIDNNCDGTDDACPAPSTSSGGSSDSGTNEEFREANSVSTIVTPIVTPVTPVIPTVEEETEEVTTLTEESNALTGAAIINNIKENPIAAGLVALLVLGLIIGAVYYFKRK